MSEQIKGESTFSPKAKCWLFALTIFVSPVLTWPLTMLMQLIGCQGNEGVGIHCTPFLGIDLSPIANALFMYSAWGFIISMPLGIVVFLLCGFAPWRRDEVNSRNKELQRDKSGH